MYPGFLQTIWKRKTNKQTHSRGILASYPMTNFSNQKLPFPLSTMHPKENKSTFGISANDALSLRKHLLSTCYVTSKWQWQPTPALLQPTPALLSGKSHGQRSLIGYSPWGRKELDTTERLHFHFTHPQADTNREGLCV